MPKFRTLVIAGVIAAAFGVVSVGAASAASGMAEQSALTGTTNGQVGAPALTGTNPHCPSFDVAMGDVAASVTVVAITNVARNCRILARLVGTAVEHQSGDQWMSGGFRWSKSTDGGNGIYDWLVGVAGKQKIIAKYAY